MSIAQRQFRLILRNAASALLVVITVLGAGGSRANADKLLNEAADFTGTFIYLEAKVPGMVIGVIRNGETSVHGFGKIADGSDKEPDGDTLMRVGSITQSVLRRRSCLHGSGRHGLLHRSAARPARLGREDPRA